MVGPPPAGKAGDFRPINRFWSWLKQDLAGFRTAIRPSNCPDPGLYAYRFKQNGHQRRVHLRIEDDRTGVLFFDVTQVIHLNPAGATLARDILDEFQAHGIENGRQSSRSREGEELARIIRRLLYPGENCPVCSESSLQIKPPFSETPRAPYKADLALTYGCNNSCGHCYNEPGRKKGHGLSREEWRQVIDILAQVGVPHIIFTGGEPTLHPDLAELIAQAEDLGLVCGLNTNGRKLAEPGLADRLKAAGLDHVQITLESLRPEVHEAMTGAASYNETLAGIKNSERSGLHTITNTTLTSRNLDQAVETLEFLHGLGLTTAAMNGMIYSGRGKAAPEAVPEEELAPVLAAVRDRAEDLGMTFLWYTPTEYCRLSPLELDIGFKRCNAGEYSLCVEPDGSVLPCQSYYEPVGNLLTDPWDRIWNSPLFLRFRNRIKDPSGSGLPEDCWDCPDLDICAGGCPLARTAACC